MNRLCDRISCLAFSNVTSFLTVAVLVGFIVLAGCGGGGGGGTGSGGNSQPTVTAVTVSCASTSVLVEGTCTFTVN